MEDLVVISPGKNRFASNQEGVANRRGRIITARFTAVEGIGIDSGDLGSADGRNELASEEVREARKGRTFGRSSGQDIFVPQQRSRSAFHPTPQLCRTVRTGEGAAAIQSTSKVGAAQP